LEEISTTFRVNRLHQIKSVRKVLEKDNDDTSILSRDIVIGANAYLYTNRNILLTTYIKKDAAGKAIATIDTDFGLGSIYAGVDVFGTGNYSLNIGNNNEVNTNYSAAIGTGLVPRTENGIVIGKYNDKTVTDNYYVVIGGGTASQGKDLVTIDTTGVTKINNSDNAENINTGALRVMGGILSQGTNYFTNITRIINNKNATSADTGALRVTGGIYSGGENWFANKTVINNNTGADSNGQGALKVVGGIYSGGTNYFNGITSIANGEGSTRLDTGALRVTGGIYTGSDNYFNSNTIITGTTKITNTTSADTVNTGALQVSGGIYSGDTNFFAGRTIINNDTNANIDGTQGALKVVGGIYSGGVSYFTKGESSTGSTSGALRVAGGIYTSGKNYFAAATPANNNEAALYVVGGIHTGQDNYFDSNTTITGITKITNVNEDALQITGGIQVSKRASVNDLTVTNTATFTGTDKLLFGTTSLASLLSQTAPADTTVQVTEPNGDQGTVDIPVYIDKKVAKACNKYAGGTKVTLNGNDKGATTASFYAPTESSTTGYILQSQQYGEPTWVSPMAISVNSAQSAKTLAVLNTGSSTQPVYFHDGVPVASNKTVGGNTTPIYFKNGVITSCSNYAGGTKVTLNGNDKGATTASFYAPTSSGSNNQVLISQGENTSPTWITANDDTKGLTVRAAKKLVTSHILRVNLENVNSTQYFNGTADAQNIAITGVLPEAHGGTGKELVQKSTMRDIGIKMGIYSPSPDYEDYKCFLWIDTPCSVEEAVVRFNYASTTLPPMELYLWGCKCKAIGWNQQIAGSEVCIGKMTRVTPATRVYTLSTRDLDQDNKDKFKDYLNIENTSFTVSKSKTSSEPITGSENILYPIEVNQQTLESALKVIAANIQKLKE